MREKTIFEKGSKGRKGVSIPTSGIPSLKDENYISTKFLAQSELPFPELSELDVVRHYSNLARKNFSVDTHFYPLGSCTMKYNPKINEEIASMSKFTQLHPYQSEESAQGALQLIWLLEDALKKITGMDAFTLQPAAGAHGEFTAMLMTRKWFADRKEPRNIILVPDSSHGTNPASAAMTGMKVVHIASNEQGRVDLEDLASKLDEHTACFMMTNPNTLGLFESDIIKIASMVHNNGGLLYYDGANLNATLGLVRPGDAGFDFVHLNLHKTFSTPHGGGGPGAGPVGARGELAKYLPIPSVVCENGKYRFDYDRKESIGRVKAFYGNYMILVRALCYIQAVGREHLQDVGKMAVLNANYLAALLKEIFDFPYGTSCMHEFVASASNFKKYGVRALDIAKRLSDYGFHAPTIYFPLIVEEALMAEPTETESKETLDAFAEAVKSIAAEAAQAPEQLMTSPHTMPVHRVDDVLAARKPHLKWQKEVE